MGWVGWPLLNG